MIAVKSEPPKVSDSDTLDHGYAKRLADRAGVSRTRIKDAALIYRYAGELVDHLSRRAASLTLLTSAGSKTGTKPMSRWSSPLHSVHNGALALVSAPQWLVSLRPWPSSSDAKTGGFDL